MITLHGYWRSSAAYRVRIALNLKGVAYTEVAHDLRRGEQASAPYASLNPQKLVPALEADGLTLTQSLAIIEWLDERYPDPPLLPATPGERAIVRAMSATIACDIHPLHNLRVLDALRAEFGASRTAVIDWIARWIGAGFAALEPLVACHGRGFAFGDRAGMADCLLVPQLYAAERFAVDLAPYPAVVAAGRAARALPAFAAAHPSVQPNAGPA